MDDVKLDLRNTAVKRWKTRALDRKEWAAVMREVKGTKTTTTKMKKGRRRGGGGGRGGVGEGGGGEDYDEE